MRSRFIHSLSDRRARAYLQVLALAAIALAVGLATLGNAGPDAAAILLVGGVCLLSLKAGLISLNRRSPGEPTESIRAELDGLRRMCDAQAADIESLGQATPTLTTSLEHQAVLIQRTEPALAEFATLRHEVAYLREALERLRCEVDA